MVVHPLVDVYLEFGTPDRGEIVAIVFYLASPLLKRTQKPLPVTIRSIDHRRGLRADVEDEFAAICRPGSSVKLMDCRCGQILAVIRSLSLHSAVSHCRHRRFGGNSSLRVRQS